jgi:hypothetical protein
MRVGLRGNGRSEYTSVHGGSPQYTVYQSCAIALRSPAPERSSDLKRIHNSCACSFSPPRCTSHGAAHEAGLPPPPAAPRNYRAPPATKTAAKKQATLPKPTKEPKTTKEPTKTKPVAVRWVTPSVTALLKQGGQTRG